jgi:hypothetical protein
MNPYRRSTTIPGSLGTDASSLDDAHLYRTSRGLMAKARFMSSPRPNTHYRRLDHCQPRPKSRKSMTQWGVSAVWCIGDAFCKVKISIPNATREHVTLVYLYGKTPLSFATPAVHYHAEYDGRYYIILSRLTGQTLTQAWPQLDKTMKQYYVCGVVNICKELAVWQADRISGVDGHHLSETYLTRFGQPEDYSPQNLLANCKALGMDCSVLVFYHCDLGPGNIIVNNGSIGIIDWETTGFVTREWIRTKFRVSGGMDLPGSDQEWRVDWRRRVQRQLEVDGFPDIANRWMIWWSD